MLEEKFKAVRNVLEKRGSEKLSSLLAGARYELNESGTFGSCWHSILTEVEVFTPLEEYEELLLLSEEEKGAIFDAFLLIYPLRDGELELTNVNYFYDPELKPPGRRVKTEYLDALTASYVSEQIKKAEVKVEGKDFDGAVTNAGTLVETVCKQILDEYGVKPKLGLKKLYEQTSKVLNMNAAAHEEESFKKTLGGFASVITGLAETRNAHSDAHGKIPSKRYSLSKRHANLCVGAAQIVAEYLLATYEERKSK